MSSSNRKNSIRIDLEEGVELCISVKTSHDCNRHANEKENRADPLTKSKITITSMDNDQDLGGIVLNQSYRLQIHCIADNGHVMPLHQGWDNIKFQNASATVDLIKLGVDGGPINGPALDGVLYGILTPKEVGTAILAATVIIGAQEYGYIRRDVNIYSSK